MPDTSFPVHELQEEFIPELAIILYARNERRYGDQQYYLEGHQFVKTSNSNYTLQHGLPLTESCLQSLSKYLNRHEKEQSQPLYFEGLIPSNVLNYNCFPDSYVITWAKPAGISKLSFTKELNLPNGDYPLPGLIFKATKNSLSVYAYTDKVITTNSTLYIAPLPNIFDNGNLCIGSAKRPNNLTTFNQAIRQWEHLFFASYFSHFAENTSPVEGNWHSLFITLHQSPDPFPTNKLLPCSSTVNSLIS
ncbi:MAG: hypothetical protein RID25_23365 [Cyclobacteriaceae bacterium]